MTGGVSGTEIPFQPEAHWSVPWLLADRIARTGDKPLVARKSSVSGDWQEVSARAFAPTDVPLPTTCVRTAPARPVY